MTFTHLPQISNFIRRTHESFAGLPVSETLSVLRGMNASMLAFPAMVGATFEAVTDADHGAIRTEIEINKIHSGGWEYVERRCKMKIYTADRETGTCIEEVKTIQEGYDLIAEYEKSDKEDGIYKPDFYDIVDEYHRSQI